MNWRTHAVVGANALWVLPLVHQSLDASILFLLPSAVVGALLPDIDAHGSGAKVHYVAGGVLGAFRGLFFGKLLGHRGLFHSLSMALVLFLIAWSFTHEQYPSAALVFAIGYITHIIIDGFNTGVGYLFPFWLKRFALVPRFFLTPVGGTADTFLFILGLFGIALFFLANAKSFLSQ